MFENDRYCIDILTQISAAQAALDKVALGSPRRCETPATGSPAPTSAAMATATPRSPATEMSRPLGTQSP